MNPETSLVYQHELYKTGKMSKQQLMAYKNALSEADDDEGARKVYGELLAQLTDEEKVQPEFWSIYEDESCVIGSPVSDFMLEHLEDIRKNSGQRKSGQLPDKQVLEAFRRLRDGIQQTG